MTASQRGLRHAGRAALLASVVIALVAAGCATRNVDVEASDPTEPPLMTSPTRTGPPSTSARTPAGAASGFTLTSLPDGYSLVALADGTAAPIYSDDSFGGIHPMLVLVPDDWGGLDDHRWIEVTSIDGSGNEGGIYQELPDYSNSRADLERFELRGHPAIRLPSADLPDEVPAHDRRRVAGFVAVNTSATVRQGIDGADRRGVLVTGPDEDLDLFAAVAGRTRTTADRTPFVDDPPDGWQVLGTLDSTQAITNLDVWIDQPAAGRRGAMLGGPTDRAITVQALAGNERVPLLKAIERSWQPYDSEWFGAVSQFARDGVTGFALDCCRDAPPGTPKEWTVWFERDGAPFLATGVLDRDVGIALAAGVQPITDAQWSAAQRTVGSTPPTRVPAPTYTTLPGDTVPATTVPATTSVIVPPGG